MISLFKNLIKFMDIISEAERKLLIEKYRDEPLLLEEATESARNDREIVLEAVKSDGNALEYVSEDLKNDREIVLEAVKQQGLALEFASEKLKGDSEIVLEAVNDFSRSFEFASNNIKDNKEVVLKVLKGDGSTFNYISERLKNDDEIWLEIIEDNPSLLSEAPEEIKNNRKIVLLAVKERGGMLKYASENLKNDREIVTTALTLKDENDFLFGVYQYVSEDLKSDPQIVLTALKNDCLELESAPEIIKNNSELMLEVIKKDPLSFNTFPEYIKNDREIVLELLNLSYGRNLHRSEAFPLRELLRDFIVKHKDFKDDLELNKLLIKINSNFIEAITSEKIKGNFEIFKEIIEEHSDRDYFKLASETLRADKEFALYAVNLNSKNLEFVSENLKDDNEIVLLAVKADASALEYASDRLRDNYEIVLEAVKKSAIALSKASDRLKDDREIVLAAAKGDRSGIFLNHASDRLKDDREIALLAVSGAMGGMGFQYVSDRLRDDREIALKALEKSPGNTIAIKYVSDNLKKDEEIIKACKQGDITIPAVSSRNPFKGINNEWKKRDGNEIPLGFVSKKAKGKLEFFPIQVDSEYLCSHDRKRQLSDLDRAIFGKVKSQIENKGLNSFPTFIENPDEGCFQNELLFWIKNDDSMKELLFKKCNDEEIEKIEEWMEQSEGGFRPTLYLDSDDEDYSFAEESETLFNLIESNAIFYAASVAAERGNDLSLIYEYFEECGWEEEIQALKDFKSS